MDAKHRVYVYHINVGLGDSAILVRTDTSGTEGRWWAILVDGGTGTNENKDNLEATMRLVEKKHDIEEFGLKFHAVVITHWDEDHWGGLSKLLEGDTNLEASGKFKYFRYDGDTPKTVVYATMSTAIAQAEKPKKKPDDPNVVQPTAFGIIDIIGDEKEAAFVCHKKRIAKARIGLSVLGREFFTDARNDQLISDGAITEVTLESLLNGTKVEGATEPLPVGFYCVAVNRRVVANYTQLRDDYPETLAGSDAKYCSMTPERSITVTASNRSSIINILAWNSKHVSHYFAADAYATTESWIAVWLRAAKVETITCIKASHHGARTSNPPLLLKWFKPKRIMISAASMHAHPSWQYCLTIHAYAVTEKHTVAPAYMIRYPHWMTETIYEELGIDSHLKGINIDPLLMEESPRWKALTKDKQHEAKHLQDLFESWYGTLFDDSPMGQLRKQMKDDPDSFMNSGAEDLMRVLSYEMYMQYDKAWNEAEVHGDVGDRILYYALELFDDKENDGAIEPTRVAQAVQGKKPRKKYTRKPATNLKKSKTETDTKNTTMSLKTITKKKKDDSKYAKYSKSVVASVKALKMDVPVSVVKTQMLIETRRMKALREAQGGGKPKKLTAFKPVAAGRFLVAKPVEERTAERAVPAQESGSAQNAAPAQNTPIPYSLFCSSLANATQYLGESASHRMLDISDPLDDFVEELLGQAFHLQAAPQKDPGWIPLQTDDPLSQWLALAMQGTMMIKCSDTTVTSLGIDVGVLKFRTDLADKALLALAELSPLGLSPWTECGTMVFGLDMSSTEAKDAVFTTEQVFNTLPALKAPISQNATLLGDMKWKLDTSEHSRQAIWLCPAADYSTVGRLQFCLADSAQLDKMTTFFKKFLNMDVSISNLVLISTKATMIEASSIATSTPGKLERAIGPQTTRSMLLSAIITISASIDLGNGKVETASISPRATVELNDENEWVLEICTPDDKSDFLKFFQVIKWWLLNKLGSTSSTNFDDLNSQGVTKSWRFRRLRIKVQKDDEGTSILTEASIAIEASAQIGSSKSQQNIPILLEAGYTPGADSSWFIYGGLWFKDTRVLPLDLLSYYEKVQVFDPITPNAASSLLLTTLLGTDETEFKKPVGFAIPDEITRASFRIDSKRLILLGTISGCKQQDAGVPVLDLNQVEVEAIIGFKPNVSQQLMLRFRMLLNFPDESETCVSCATTIRGEFVYDSTAKTWSISARVGELNLGMLYDLFDKSYRGVLYDLLKAITIKYMNFAYVAVDGVQTLRAEGAIVLADVISVGLTYEHHGGSNWFFQVDITPEIKVDHDVTLGGVMKSLLGDDTTLVSDLPSFLTDLVILGPNVKKPYLRLRIDKDKATDAVRFEVQAGISDIEIQFVQVASKNGKPIRLFKGTLGNIPLPDDVPLIGHMEKPFDKLGFVWVNSELKDDQITMLDPTFIVQKESTEDAGPLVMRAGFHFIIFSKDKLVLDYPFSKAPSNKNEQVSSTGKEVAVQGNTGDKNSAPPSGNDTKTAQSPKAKFKKTIGPVTITDIGWKSKDSTLSIVMDATFTFGPVALDLIGFGIGLHFEGGERKPDSGFFSNVKVVVSISGLGVDFNKPPLTISGTFVYIEDEGSVYYAGGASVGFSPWLFQAAGYYGMAQLRDKQLKTFFIYATLRGPIMSFGFADISGLTGAFAYNIDLTLPTIDQVTSFPLLAPQAPQAKMKDTIMAILPQGNTPSPYFTVRDDARWLAAGLTVTAFQMIEITALVVFQWSPHVQLAILGLAVCDLPSPKSSFKLAHIELGILATVDIQGGIFKVEAQLSPNSYILHPSCHLTGGFAMYYWFKSNGTAIQGDWVCSAGGYHAAFAIPPHYPRPERLKISWSIDKSLSISGEAYFAITPKVCMGGLHIHAALNLGALSAWFDAYADFLINFAPFHFMAEGHISVGIRFSMDVWFVTISISAEIGATLTLAGPPLHGNVHVDFWVFGFDIAFGDNSQPEKAPLTIDEFWKLVMQSDAPPKDKPATGGEVKAPHVYTCQQGLLSSGNAEVKPEDPWSVRGGVLSFGISAHFAATYISVNGVDQGKAQGAGEVYAKPMKLTEQLDSQLAVEVIHVDGTDRTRTKTWTAKTVVKAVPTGVWGRYDSSTDPTRTTNSSSMTELLRPDGGTTDLMMGLQLAAPEATFSIGNLIQFDVDKAMMQNAYQSSHPQPSFIVHDMDSEAWHPLNDVGDKQWVTVRDVWQAAGEPKETVGLFEDVFGGMKLSPAKPDRFIKSLDVLCLQAPLIRDRTKK